ncbi:Crp/Fnr family transcriptional regulator [Aquimarina mytili]|uniref:Crp/Fnr family transcriptional regulator n=1 Tax=Aquimarina mytili TaxID=874423 RepID=A0A937DA94_9FLAO|nr:Crp/Fnr family transcriptional regulator [Aquimarina mytili]MBL0682451.1 Crp/Fnr family transcriptional regulator [Aquimarina mytili]
MESLPKNILDQIEENKTVLNLKKGQVLFHEGTIPMGVYILKTGKVKKYTQGINGKEHIFYLIKENEIFGYHSLLSEETYSHSAGCLTDCTFELIPKKTFYWVIENDSKMLHRLLKSMSHEFGVFITNSKILAQHNVRERTALSLIKLEQFFNDHCIKLSRRDLSNIVGTSIESLVRVLHDFKEEEAIDIKESTITVRDMKKLIDTTNFI